MRLEGDGDAEVVDTLEVLSVNVELVVDGLDEDELDDGDNDDDDGDTLCEGEELLLLVCDCEDELIVVVVEGIV